MSDYEAVSVPEVGQERDPAFELLDDMAIFSRNVVLSIGAVTLSLAIEIDTSFYYDMPRIVGTTLAIEAVRRMFLYVESRWSSDLT